MGEREKARNKTIFFISRVSAFRGDCCCQVWSTVVQVPLREDPGSPRDVRGAKFITVMRRFLADPYLNRTCQPRCQTVTGKVEFTVWIILSPFK